MAPRAGAVRQWDVVLAVAAGGAIGGGARHLVSQLVPHPDAGFPLATFVENVSGCFLLGALTVVLLGSPSRYLRPFLAVGVLGGYTTFSTYAADVSGLAATGQWGLGVTYLVGSVLAGLLAAAAGLALARRSASWFASRNS